MNDTMRRCLLLLAAALCVAAILLAWRGWRRPRTAEPGAAPGFASIPSPAPGEDSASRDETRRKLREAASVLGAGGNAGAARQALDGLRGHLQSLRRADAAAALRAELASGRDAVTGLGFRPGPGGTLAESPSWRVFLLEELARVDPPAAAELARTILATKTSPDEWAVALRNVARVESGAESRAFLEGRMRELLTYEPWQREAAAGYLEAFDVAVHLGGANLVPELASLVRKPDHRAVSHAAYLALDRLVIRDPAPLLARLAAEPALLAGREATRANYFARADAADPAQRAALERYLLDPARSPEELQTFATVYPNANFMISENLLTSVTPPDRAALARRDAAALRVVNEWLADGRFASRREPLERARSRLEKFARQAESR